MKNLLFLFVVLFASLTFSATIFGPVQYERTSGPPNVYDTSFVAYDTTVACTLLVINGDEHGHHRLSAASVEFNGEEIISEDDFNQHIGTIIRVITLRRDNIFHLRLRSAPGAFLTLSVLRPCDAFVSLSVDTVIGDSACFSASANGWGELTYSWDFDGDGTLDTTTTNSTICHVYEEADTYWAKVQVEDEVGCVERDSEEVVVEILHFKILWEKEYPEGTIDERIGFGFTSGIPNAILYVYHSDSNFIEYLDSLGNKVHTVEFWDSSFLIGISPNGQFLAVIEDTLDLESTFYDYDRIFKLTVLNYLGDTLWQADSAYRKAFISDDGHVVWNVERWMMFPSKFAVLNSARKKDLEYALCTGAPDSTGHLFLQHFKDTIFAINDTGGVEWVLPAEGFPDFPRIFDRAIHWVDTIAVVNVQYPPENRAYFVSKNGIMIDTIPHILPFIGGANKYFSSSGRYLNLYCLTDSGLVEVYRIELTGRYCGNLRVFSDGEVFAFIRPDSVMKIGPVTIFHLNSTGEIVDSVMFENVALSKGSEQLCRFHSKWMVICIGEKIKLIKLTRIGG